MQNKSGRLKILSCSLRKQECNEGLKKLTPYALRELVKAIYVEKSDKSSDKKRQKIRIRYDLVDFILIN